MTTTTIRTGSTRASRPVGLRKRVSARAVVPTLAGIAIAALAVTATVQLGAPNDGESRVLAVAADANPHAGARARTGPQGAISGEQLLRWQLLRRSERVLRPEHRCDARAHRAV